MNMKKILFFILLIPLLFGCEIYTERTNPQYTINGNWTIVDIIPTYSEDLKVINDNYYAIAPFDVISINNNQWLIKNDTTGILPCYFYKKGYIWEFDYNNLIIKNDRNKILGQYYINFWYGYHISLIDKSTMANISGEFILFFPQIPYGATPESVMYIRVPEYNFNLDGPERRYDRLIKQNITLTFMR